MRMIPELRRALAVNAAAFGAAFISGREAATFFAATGSASWAGIITAAVFFGLITGMISKYAGNTGIFARYADLVTIGYGLLMLLMGASALSTAGELGLLSLGCRNPGLIASGTTLIIAIMLSLRSMQPLALMGTICIPVWILFFILLALDPRTSDTTALLSKDMLDITGNVPAAIFMGLLFACLKAALTCGAAAAQARRLSPLRFGLCSGGIMLLVIASANFALQKSGAHIWTLNLPTVVLASRWGVFGYYVSIYAMWLGCVCTLACALGSLNLLFRRNISRIASATAVCIMSLPSLKHFTGAAFSVLGWIFTVFLAIIIIRRRGRGTSFPIKSQIL